MGVSMPSRRHRALLAAVLSALLVCGGDRARTVAASTTPVAPAAPVRLRIPALHLDAAIEPVGRDGVAMATPTRPQDVAWYAPGPRPGAVGNAAIDGHLDTAAGPAVFRDLHVLRVGDRVAVIDRRGRRYTFAVTALRVYPARGAPLQAIFGPTAARHLNLITCAGVWIPARQDYDRRLIVFTQLIPAPWPLTSDQRRDGLDWTPTARISRNGMTDNTATKDTNDTATEDQVCPPP